MRYAIAHDAIQELQIWYVHNLPKSINVGRELVNVENTAKTLVGSQFPGTSIAIHTYEIGSERLEEWYGNTQTPILVSTPYQIPISVGFRISGKEWEAFVTTISLGFLHRLYGTFGSKLFSANVRDYLGSKRSDANINNGIKQSASEQPNNFWVFNNGLTILVNDFQDGRDGRDRHLLVNGVSIVNGAQTTGAIGSLDVMPNEEGVVLARFVKTNSKHLVQDIVHFDNSQNKITASDFRSTDAIQRRLKEEVLAIPDSEYDGGRRGGIADVLVRRPNLMPSYTIGQALAAVHSDPVVAYNDKTNIWVNDRYYSRYFNEDSTALHLVFCYGLLRACERRKMKLLQKLEQGEGGLTQSDQEQLRFFRHRGSIYLLGSV